MWKLTDVYDITYVSGNSCWPLLNNNKKVTSSELWGVKHCFVYPCFKPQWNNPRVSIKNNSCSFGPYCSKTQYDSKINIVFSNSNSYIISWLIHINS